MENEFILFISSLSDFQFIILVVAVILFLIWSLIWKGWALWVSAQKRSITWFVIFLVVNTVGILEILYIFVFSKKNKTQEINSPNPNQTQNN